MKNDSSKIPVKNASGIAAMRAIGRVTAEVLDAICAGVREGVSTAELDRIAARELRKRGARSASLGYPPGGDRPFPAQICVSVNDEVVHGIPSERRILGRGDIVSIDVVPIRGGYMGDSTRTVAVGDVDDRVALLLRETENALWAGIAQAVEGNHVGDISAAVEAHANKFHLGIVRNLTGHGIGREMHEPPTIPNYGQAGSGPVLRAGMTLAIEPMLLLGKEELRLDGDGWTVRSADGSWSAHFEHTVLITKTAPEVLTAIKK